MSEAGKRLKASHDQVYQDMLRKGAKGVKYSPGVRRHIERLFDDEAEELEKEKKKKKVGRHK